MSEHTSKPSARELLDLWHNSTDSQEADGYGLDIFSRVEAVLALHKRRVKALGFGRCEACFDEPWPCPTVRLLDGEEP